MARACRGKRRSVACQASWQRAIEHVHAARDHFQQLRWRAKSHRITWFLLRQKWFARFHGTDHFLFRLAYTDSTNGIAIKIKIDNRLRALLAQIIKCGALNDAKEKLIDT